MPSGPIVVGADRKSPPEPRVDPTRVWKLLSPVGVLFFVAGFADILLALFPPQLSRPEWRFSAANVLISGWPLVLVGATVMAVTALARARPALAVIGAVANLLCLVLMACAVTSLLAGWDQALATVALDMQAGLSKGVVKGVLAGSLYALTHGYASWALTREFRRS